MPRVRVYHADVTDLSRDFQRSARRVPGALTRVTRAAVHEGYVTARKFAKATARRHGKHYPPTITGQMTGPTKGEWGPDLELQRATMFRRSGSARGWSYEDGSVNQPPHNDLANSADVVVPKWWKDIDDIAAAAFWPGGVKKW